MCYCMKYTKFASTTPLYFEGHHSWGCKYPRRLVKTNSKERSQKLGSTTEGLNMVMTIKVVANFDDCSL